MYFVFYPTSCVLFILCCVSFTFSLCFILFLLCFCIIFVFTGVFCVCLTSQGYHSDHITQPFYMFAFNKTKRFFLQTSTKWLTKREKMISETGKQSCLPTSVVTGETKCATLHPMWDTRLLNSASCQVSDTCVWNDTYEPISLSSRNSPYTYYTIYRHSSFSLSFQWVHEKRGWEKKVWVLL